jgi:beta-lactamase class A
VPSSPVGQSQPGQFQNDAAGLLSFEQPAYCKGAPAGLQSDLSQIAQTIDGKAGIAVRRVGCSWVAGERLRQFFPQQSVSKLWVSLAVLDAVDQRKAQLNEVLEIGRGDLTVFHQPVRSVVLEQGLVRLPMHQLIFDAITHSDNTANDRLLHRVGGSAEIRRVLQRKGLSGIRFGPGERLLQSQIAGLRWTPELSLGSNFEQARARLPLPARQAALANYLADPIDGATPSGLSQALSLLAAGRLLSPASTDFAMGTLARTKSGPRRLKGGVPPDWKVYHKTGTGQVLGPISTGYNDVGILEAPDGARYAVAVMIGETTSPIQARMQMMQLVSAAVAHHHSPAAEAAMASASEAQAKPDG